MGSEHPSAVCPGQYFIACQLNPAHRVLDLPSQLAHRDSGLVQAISRNGSAYQKWWIEPVPEAPGIFTIRSGLNGGRYVEPIRGPSGALADGILLGFYGKSDSPFQHWRFERHEARNSYYIVNEGSGKYWDLREQDPSHIQQLGKKETLHQLWVLEAVR